jgi:hypothetical protein
VPNTAELDPLPDDDHLAAVEAAPEDEIARGNGRIAAGLLAALILGALLLIAAGQALGHQEGCGEPGSGNAQPIAGALA